MSLAEVVGVLLVVVEYGIKVVAVGTIPEDRRPGSSHAWLLLILLLPVVGLPLFLLLGSPWVTGRRHRLQEEVNRAVARQLRDVPVLPEGEVAGPHRASLLAQNRRLTALPCLAGNYRRAIAEDDLVPVLVEAVDGARRNVHVEFYIMALDATTRPLFEAMARAVDRGVRVRLLFDHLGARGYPGYHEMTRWLTAHGVQWYRMMPIDPLRRRWRRPDLRNHRKIVVVDGERAFMGSQNLIDPGYLKPKNQRAGRRWVDLNVEVSGDVVQSLQAVFGTDWYTESGEVLEDELRHAPSPSAGTGTAGDGEPAGARGAFQVVPSGPGFPTEPNLRLFTALIAAATRSVSIVSPYFIPDEGLEQAITSAAYRGVPVELFVSEKADQFMVHHAQRSYYGPLLRAGVRIHCLPAPGVLHSKLLVVDGADPAAAVAVIGSSNMDIRSFQLDYEVSLLGLEPTFVADLTSWVDDYRERSVELTAEQWQDRPLHLRYVDNLMRLTAALQ